jgi:hypothetical protein
VKERNSSTMNKYNYIMNNTTLISEIINDIRNKHSGCVWTIFSREKMWIPIVLLNMITLNWNRSFERWKISYIKLGLPTKSKFTKYWGKYIYCLYTYYTSVGAKKKKKSLNAWTLDQDFMLYNVFHMLFKPL